MDLKEKIEKQLKAGFPAEQVYENLLADGYSRNEIDQEFRMTAAEIKESRQPNIKNIVFGSLFIVIVTYRIWRYANTSSSGAASILGMISIFTGIALAIYFFTRKK